jgi:hypothetical protein
MRAKSSITQTSAKDDRLSLVRPANGWDYLYVTTSPEEMLAEEFLKPLGLQAKPFGDKHPCADDTDW